MQRGVFAFNNGVARYISPKLLSTGRDKCHTARDVLPCQEKSEKKTGATVSRAIICHPAVAAAGGLTVALRCRRFPIAFLKRRSPRTLITRPV